MHVSAFISTPVLPSLQTFYKHTFLHKFNFQHDESFSPQITLPLILKNGFKLSFCLSISVEKVSAEKNCFSLSLHSFRLFWTQSASEARNVYSNQRDSHTHNTFQTVWVGTLFRYQVILELQSSTHSHRVLEQSVTQTLICCNGYTWADVWCARVIQFEQLSKRLQSSTLNLFSDNFTSSFSMIMIQIPLQ